VLYGAARDATGVLGSRGGAKNRPLFLAVPYDERLAKEEVHVVVAVHLYERGVVSLGRAAKIAGLSLSAFIDRLGALKIPVARYSPDELSRELAEFG
jgi:predicted HTH domain antitoxin